MTNRALSWPASHAVPEPRLTDHHCPFKCRYKEG